MQLALIEATAMRDTRHRDALAYPDVVAWLDYLDLDGKSQRTLYAYERATAPLLRANLDTALDEFTTDDVKAQLTRIPQRSRYISRSIYNGLFSWALDEERIAKSPMGRVPKMHAGPRIPKDIFAPEEIAILQALPIPHGPLFAILFGTGIRRAEARHLRRDRIDLNRMRMVVTGKGEKTRIIPFGAEVATAIADLDLYERLAPSDHLWHRKRYAIGDARRRTDPIGDSTFDLWYRDQLRGAGVRIGPDGRVLLNPHQTRHTFQWTMRQGGLDLEDRQALLGHASPETTVRQYGRIDLEDLAARVAAL